jgi:hypothetical protein
MEARILIETPAKAFPGTTKRMLSVSVELRKGSWSHTQAVTVEDGHEAYKQQQLNKAVMRILRARGRSESFYWND